MILDRSIPARVLVVPAHKPPRARQSAYSVDERFNFVIKES